MAIILLTLTAILLFRGLIMNIIGVIVSPPFLDGGVCSFGVTHKGVKTEVKIERKAVAESCFSFLKEGSAIHAIGEYIENYFSASRVFTLTPGGYERICEVGLQEVI